MEHVDKTAKKGQATLTVAPARQDSGTESVAVGPVTWNISKGHRKRFLSIAMDRPAAKLWSCGQRGTLFCREPRRLL
jgi:hypothetical protein